MCIQTTMKTKTTLLKTAFIACLAHLMAGTVVLSHMHAGDVVSHSVSKDSLTQVTKSSPDLNAKAVGDLHNHIDKTMLKNIMKSAADSSTAASRRDLKPQQLEYEESILERLAAQFLMFRVFMTLPITL
jgi:hypothetical protein